MLFVCCRFSLVLNIFGVAVFVTTLVGLCLNLCLFLEVVCICWVDCWLVFMVDLLVCLWVLC